MVQTEDGRKIFGDISETGRIVIFKSLLEDGRIIDIKVVTKLSLIGITIVSQKTKESSIGISVQELSTKESSIGLSVLETFTKNSSTGLTVVTRRTKASSIGLAILETFTKASSIGLTIVNKETNASSIGITITTEQGIIGAWDLNEDALDSSGLENNGSLNGGMGYTNGWHGQGALFDGDNDHINCGTNPCLNLTSAVTIAAWIKPGNNPEIAPVITKGCLFGAYALNIRNDLVQFKAGPLRYKLHTFTPGVWYHIAGTYGDGYTKIYINGEVVYEKAESGAINTVAEALCIGWDEDDVAPTPHYEGVIDEGKVYCRALTEGEILELYNRGFKTSSVGMTVVDRETKTSSIGLEIISLTRKIFPWMSNFKGISEDGRIEIFPGVFEDGRQCEKTENTKESSIGIAIIETIIKASSIGMTVVTRKTKESSIGMRVVAQKTKASSIGMTVITRKTKESSIGIAIQIEQVRISLIGLRVVHIGKKESSIGIQITGGFKSSSIGLRVTDLARLEKGTGIFIFNGIAEDGRFEISREILEDGNFRKAPHVKTKESSIGISVQESCTNESSIGLSIQETPTKGSSIGVSIRETPIKESSIGLSIDGWNIKESSVGMVVLEPVLKKGFFYATLGDDILEGVMEANFRISKEMNRTPSFEFEIANCEANRTLITENDGISKDFKIYWQHHGVETRWLTGIINADGIEYVSLDSIKISGFASYVKLSWPLHKHLATEDKEPVNKVFDFDGSYHDRTWAANSPGINDVITHFSDVNHALYIGENQPFWGAQIEYHTKGVREAAGKYLTDWTKHGNNPLQSKTCQNWMIAVYSNYNNEDKIYLFEQRSGHPSNDISCSSFTRANAANTGQWTDHGVVFTGVKVHDDGHIEPHGIIFETQPMADAREGVGEGLGTRKWRMYYCALGDGEGTNKYSANFCYAAESDLTNWTAYNGNPVYDHDSEWGYADTKVCIYNNKVWLHHCKYKPGTTCNPSFFSYSDYGLGDWTDKTRNWTTERSVIGTLVPFNEGILLTGNVSPYATYEALFTTDGDDKKSYSGNPVLSAGANGQWDDKYIFWSSIVVDKNGNSNLHNAGEYYMYYVGYDGAAYKIGLATSSTLTEESGSAIELEYSKGLGMWGALDALDESDGFTEEPGTYNLIIPHLPSDWARNTVAGNKKYWMRYRLSSGVYTIPPKLDRIYIVNTDIYRAYYFDMSARAILENVLEGTEYEMDLTDTCPEDIISILAEYESPLRLIAAIPNALTWTDTDGSKKAYQWWIDDTKKVHIKQRRGITHPDDITGDLTIFNNHEDYFHLSNQLIGLGPRDGLSQMRAIVRDTDSIGAYGLREIAVAEEQIGKYAMLRNSLEKKITFSKAPMQRIRGSVSTQFWGIRGYDVGDTVTLHQDKWNVDEKEFQIVKVDIGPNRTTLDLGISQDHLEGLRDDMQRRMDLNNVRMHGSTAILEAGPETMNYQRVDAETVYPAKLEIEIPTTVKKIHKVLLSWTLGPYRADVGPHTGELAAHDHEGSVGDGGGYESFDAGDGGGHTPAVSDDGAFTPQVIGGKHKHHNTWSPLSCFYLGEFKFLDAETGDTVNGALHRHTKGATSEPNKSTTMIKSLNYGCECSEDCGGGNCVTSVVTKQMADSDHVHQNTSLMTGYTTPPITLNTTGKRYALYETDYYRLMTCLLAGYDSSDENPEHAHTGVDVLDHGHTGVDVEAHGDHTIPLLTKHGDHSIIAQAKTTLDLAYDIYEEAGGTDMELLVNGESVGIYTTAPQTEIRIDGWLQSGNNTVLLQPKVGENDKKGGATIKASGLIFLEPVKF